MPAEGRQVMKGKYSKRVQAQLRTGKFLAIERKPILVMLSHIFCGPRRKMVSPNFCEAMAKLWVATEGSRVFAVWSHWASLHYTSAKRFINLRCGSNWGQREVYKVGKKLSNCIVNVQLMKENNLFSFSFEGFCPWLVEPVVRTCGTQCRGRAWQTNLLTSCLLEVGRWK